MPLEKLLGRLIAKPGNLKNICDKVTTSSSSHQNVMLPFTGFDETNPSSPLLLLPRGLRCSCRQLGGLNHRVQRQSAHWRTLSLYKFTQTQQHLPGCPHRRAAVEHVNQCVGARFSGLANILGAAIELSFSVRFGAGGYGISPSFTYQPTVDAKSAPAFRIFKLVKQRIIYWDNDRRLESLKEQFALEALTRIIKLFQGKTPKASPLDVDAKNRSLIHKIAYEVGYSCR